MNLSPMCGKKIVAAALPLRGSVRETALGRVRSNYPSSLSVLVRNPIWRDAETLDARATSAFTAKPCAEHLTSGL